MFRQSKTQAKANLLLVQEGMVVRQQQELEERMRKCKEEWRKERQQQGFQHQEAVTQGLMTFQANLLKNLFDNDKK